MGKIETEHNLNDHWGTPREVWEPMVEHFGVPGLDPFWNPTSEVPAKARWTDWTLHDGWWRPPAPTAEYLPGKPEHAGIQYGVDSFELCWDGYGLVWVNGPFSKATKYLKKCSQEGDEVLFLFKTNMNARYVHNYVRPCDAVVFFDERLQYVGAKWKATFHSALGYWGNRPELLYQAYPKAWVQLRQTGQDQCTTTSTSLATTAPS